MTQLVYVPPGPPKFFRERMDIFGGPGTGKSHTWLSFLKHTHPSSQFFIVDTDAALEPAMRRPEYRKAWDAGRVHHFEPQVWPDWRDAWRTAREEMDPDRGDWFVVDLGDEAWEAVQRYYHQRALGVDPESMDYWHLLIDAASSEDDDDSDLNKWSDAINPMYNPFQKFLINVPGNLIVCSTAKEMRRRKDGSYLWESDEDIREFGGFGVKPGGQKHLAHNVNTVLKLDKRGSGVRTFTLIKDREREDAWPAPKMKNGRVVAPSFIEIGENPAQTYLQGICGWRPQVVGDDEGDEAGASE